MKDEGSVDYKHDSPQFFVQCRESEPGAFKVSGRYQAIAHLRPGTLEDLMGIFNIFYTEGDGVSVPMETYIEDSETQKGDDIDDALEFIDQCVRPKDWDDWNEIRWIYSPPLEIKNEATLAAMRELEWIPDK